MKKYTLVFAFFAFTLVAFGQSNADTLVVSCVKPAPPKQEIITQRCCFCIMDDIARRQREIMERILRKPVYLTELGSIALDHKKFRFDYRVNQIANTQAGVFSVDGETPSILGARTEGTAYYINGVRVLEGFLPQTMP